MAPQDTFFEDEEETCPLCIEEFDLSDKNFHPCPCGYQICQFCFHNIKNNLNGSCPACRRIYSEETIQYKVVTAEEQAEFRANLQKNRKKRAEQQGQKEVQKQNAENDGRKSLIGIRVVQKNLVYVTGLVPTVREDELLKTLRQPQFFGQYGNIHKISISNRKNQEGQQQSLGIYVTFERKEDAQRCIQAVNGSQNGDRVLRAQLGTTKYCSAWLRHEICSNKQCMFLHALGDEEDSYTRQDLSSLNSIAQRPLAPASRSVSRQAPSTHASQPMVRTSSKEDSESGDASALPVSANWARTTQQRSRRGSHATSGAASSPAVSMALPMTTESNEEALELLEDTSTPAEETTATSGPSSAPGTTELSIVQQEARDYWLPDILKSLGSLNLVIKEFDSVSSDAIPPLFDVRGGARRRAMRDEEEPQLEEQGDQAEPLEPSEGEPESGSLALGGEPEDREHGRESHGFDQRRPIAQPAIQRDGIFGPSIGPNYAQGAASLAAINNRSMTPQQQAYMQRPGQGSFAELPPGINTAQPALFQGQGHNRQSSRFNFATETTSSSTSVKLAANPRLMAQQSSMMPTTAFHSQPGGQFYTTSLPGPPPGLKSTGTPPSSMFGQGNGFGNGGFGAKDSNVDMLSLFRARTGASQAHDTGKHDDYVFTADATTNVDALVSDDMEDDEAMFPADAYSKYIVPQVGPAPGFTHAHPPPGLQQPIAAPSSSRHGPPTVAAAPTPVALPVTPLKPATGPSVVKSGKRVAHTPGLDAKNSIKALALESGLAKDIASQSKTSKGKKLLQDEDFPALETSKGIPSRVSTPVVPPKAPSVMTPAITRRIIEQNKAAPTTDAPATAVVLQKKETKADKRKSIPGTLNIAAAIKSAKGSNPSSTVTSAVEKTDDHAFPALPTPSSVSSPATRTAPKTLRVMATPKTEVAPSLSAGITAPPLFRSALSSQNRPGTPASDNISDTASIFSASVSASRPNSPGPVSRIGSAAIRTKTKSQQRKERKEGHKRETAAIISQPVVPEKEEIAPISGRKRKQKKEKVVNSAGATPTPTESRAQSPAPTPAAAATSLAAEKEKEDDKPAPLVEEKASAYRQAVVNESMSLEELPLSARLNKARLDKGKGKDVSRPEDGASSGDASGLVSERASPSPASVIDVLVKDGLTADAESLSLLKPISSASHRMDQYTSSVPKEGPTEVKYFVNEEDQATLLAGKAVHKIVDGARVLLTPYGNCVRNLTPAEEERYLELQKHVADDAANPATFTHARHEPAPGFSVIKGRAVANGPPSYFPQDASTLPSEPIQKMTRDEALNNINQSILPRLNLGTANLATFGRGASKNDHAAATNALNSLAPLILNFAANGVPGTAALAAELNGQSPGSSSAKLDPSDEFSGMAPTSAPIPPISASTATPNALGSTANAGAKNTSAPSVGGGPFANIPAMSIEDVEQALAMARKETEKLEKSLNQVIKKNRRLLLTGSMAGGH